MSFQKYILLFQAAVKSFTDAMRKELISTNIRIINIAPGNTRSEISLVRTKGDSAQMEKAYKCTEPLSSSEVADVVVFATSRRSNTVLSKVGPQKLGILVDSGSNYQQ
jgi:NADP-dependent 3-hydroxy acid dehydrogenase YdfG